jgi:hypothetical protein
VTSRELLRVPDPFDTLESWRAYTFRDLGSYSRPSLLLERDRLRWCLLVLDDRLTARNEPRIDWLSARLGQVEARLR